MKKGPPSSYVQKVKRFIPYALFGLSVLLYANTIGHDFTQDDAIAIYKNEFTTEGLSGISDLFTKDTFYGFFGSNKSDLVSGGRYRPLTLAFFAILWEIFGDNPLPYHLSVIIMYGLLIILIYHTFLKIAPFKKVGDNLKWAVIGALLFAVHPIHTEVVANVKGLDEIWSLGFGILATLFVLRYIDSRQMSHLIWSSILLFLGILSKENAITFLGIIPLTVFFFRKTTWSEKWKILGSLTATFVIYIALRISVVGFTVGNAPLEMMNNPFIKVVDGVYYPFTFGEKWATIIYGMGKYIGLLFFPHPLTHDYYPRHFEVMTFSNPAVILALIVNVMIIAFALVDFKKKTIVSYSVLFYLMSISLTSNIVFPIGTHLSERFLFMPSLAFCMLVGAIFVFLFYKWNPRLIASMLGVIIILFSIKTITRNQVWQSDYTLFTTDVNTSPNSAKVQNAAGGSMVTKADKIKDPQQQTELRTQAKVHLNKAIEIHPKFKNAHLLLGNALFGLQEYDLAIRSYENALKLDAGYQNAHDNIIIAYREGARYEGSQKGNISKAIQWLQKADVLKPGDFETISLLGIAHGNSGQKVKALDYFKKALELNPDSHQGHINISNAYINIGNQEMATFHRQKATLLKKN